MLLIIVICVLLSISWGVFVYGVLQHDKFVTQMANERSFEEIDKIINEDKKFLEECKIMGTFHEATLDHMELWCRIKKRKMEHEKDNYEDIVS